jgi:hypothetical protein
MVPSGSLADAWFVELLHVIKVAESFIFSRIYGGIWICISYRFVRRCVLTRCSVIVDGFMYFGVRKCLVCWIIFTNLYMKILLYVAEAVPSVGSKPDSSFDVLFVWGSVFSISFVVIAYDVIALCEDYFELLPRRWIWFVPLTCR